MSINWWSILRNWDRKNLICMLCASVAMIGVAIVALAMWITSPPKTALGWASAITAACLSLYWFYAAALNAVLDFQEARERADIERPRFYVSSRNRRNAPSRQHVE